MGEMFEKSFKQTLSKATETTAIPEDMVLIAEGESMPWFADRLGNMNMADLILGGGKPRVRPINIAQLENTYRAEPEVRLEPPLVLDSLFVEKFLSIE
jgi:hypothetical protein